MTKRLALGTAQIGMPYGIANTNGRPSSETVAEVLALAFAGGVRMLDTAVAYGESETVLGQVGIAGWDVVTKLPAIPEATTDITGWVEAQVAASLTRLGKTHLHGLLLHAPGQMHGPRANSIARALERMTETGLVARVGVSIQNPAHDLPAVLRHMTPGIVQAPFNVLDQALVAQGWAAGLRAMGCEIHTRSAFLQGLLLIAPSARPDWCARFADYWQVWDDWQAQNGIEATSACLRFVSTSPDIDYAVLGVDTPAQLRALMTIEKTPLPALPIWPAPSDPDLIDPSRWPRT